MITESQIIVRLLVAAALGLVVGYERERQDHAAGMRTHMVLVVGSALIMTLSINLAFLLGTKEHVGDPARLAAQVVSGIGFLGGGVIFRYGTNVRGLTTAASLWTVAMIGLAVGAGLFWASLAATAILLLILTVLNYIEDHLLPSYNQVHITIQADYRSGLIDQVKASLGSEKRKVMSVGIERDRPKEAVTLEIQARIWKHDRVEDVVESLTAIDGVRHVKLSE